MVDSIAHISLLFDFYGQLLTDKKQEFMRLYHEDNLSLSEIAEEFGISRAAVHDSLKSSEKALYQYEEKLGLVGRFMKTKLAIDMIDRVLDDLISENTGDLPLKEKLLEIKSVIDRIEED